MKKIKHAMGTQYWGDKIIATTDELIACLGMPHHMGNKTEDVKMCWNFELNPNIVFSLYALDKYYDFSEQVYWRIATTTKINSYTVKEHIASLLDGVRRKVKDSLFLFVSGKVNNHNPLGNIQTLLHFSMARDGIETLLWFGDDNEPPMENLYKDILSYKDIFIFGGPLKGLELCLDYLTQNTPNYQRIHVMRDALLLENKEIAMVQAMYNVYFHSVEEVNCVVPVSINSFQLDPDDENVYFMPLSSIIFKKQLPESITILDKDGSIKSSDLRKTFNTKDGYIESVYYYMLGDWFAFKAVNDYESYKIKSIELSRFANKIIIEVF
jgi:hypothetical protein